MRFKFYEYTCIQRWGHRLGSFQYYIEAQQKKAASEGAPLTAIYYCDSEKRWHTADEIVNPDTRRIVLGELYNEERHGQYGTEYDVPADRFDRLPRVCAAYEFTENKAILLTRGVMGYTELPKGFDVERFNKQRRILPEQIEAMLQGSMFGWHIDAADPLNCKEEVPA